MNPDFGQVERDPAVVNLSQFEVQFDERRPFFVEGTDAFAFGGTRGRAAAERPQFFYSRRIGGRPSAFRALYNEVGYAWLDTPEETTIAGAAQAQRPSRRLDARAPRRRDDGRGRPVLHAGRRPGEPARGPVRQLPRRGRARRGLAGRGGPSPAGSSRPSSAIRARRRSSPSSPPRRPSAASTSRPPPPAGRGPSAVVAAGSAVTGDPLVIGRLQRAPQRYYQRPDAGYLSVDPTAEALRGLPRRGGPRQDRRGGRTGGARSRSGPRAPGSRSTTSATRSGPTSSRPTGRSATTRRTRARRLSTTPACSPTGRRGLNYGGPERAPELQPGHVRPVLEPLGRPGDRDRPADVPQRPADVGRR